MAASPAHDLARGPDLSCRRGRSQDQEQDHDQEQKQEDFENLGLSAAEQAS
jgi:hypothetical protein